MATRIGVAPKVDNFKEGSPPVNDWLREVTKRWNVYSGAADPTVSEVPESQWIVYYNTTSLEVRIWTNIAGTLKKSAAFT